MRKIISMLILSSLIACSDAQILQTVPSVDLNKYAGKWFEIASFPNRFQRGCHCTTAEYVVTDKGYVTVINSCRKDSVTGPFKSITGKAFAVKGSGNAKLKVQFFWPFHGDYWIIDLASDYSYAVVGNPSRKYLWILARVPTMDSALYQEIVERIAKKGYDVSLLKKTVH